MEICLIALHLLLAVLILGVQTLLNGKLHGLHSGPMMSQRLVEKRATVHDQSHLRRGLNAWAIFDLVTAVCLDQQIAIRSSLEDLPQRGAK